MRSPYVKVVLFEDPKTNLHGAKVMGQGEDYLLLERATPKPVTNRVPKKRKRRTKAEMLLADGKTERVSAESGAAAKQ